MNWFLGLDALVRRVLLGVVAFCLLAVVIVTLSYCSERRRVAEMRSERNIAVATGEALDKVAAETPVIRQEQQEKERAVDEIEGADQRLPDGFGAELERVRRGGERPHSR